jgi:hypothetical protein
VWRFSLNDTEGQRRVGYIANPYAARAINPAPRSAYLKFK